MGLEVPHAHIHLVPINEEADMNFFKEKVSLSPDEMKNIAKKISQYAMTSHSEVY